LIQELVRDLEKKGISPVITIDGKVQKLKLIDESELRDFEEELLKFGLQKCDFCLLEEDTTQNTTLYVPADNVILIHKKSAKIKQYKVGQNSHWVVDFHHDLKSNFFTN
jgi:hypothetical protein